MAKDFAKTGVIIRESGSAALVTIADNAAVELAGPTLRKDFRTLKWEGVLKIHGLTSGQGAGLELYYGNGELSVAEMLEAINTSGPLDRNDRKNEEQAKRFVRFISAITEDAAGTDTPLYFRGPEGGPKLEYKPRWTFSDPEGWSFWIVNRSGAALTTGATFEVTLTHYGVWAE